MKKNNSNSNIEKSSIKKRRAVGEVISTLLLVVITVVGAVILTTFLDETFVAGNISVASSTDTTIKTVKLIGYDTRDGVDLMGYSTIDNNLDQTMCRDGCNANPNTNPLANGSEFLVIQIENQGVNPIYIRNILLDRVVHDFDVNTVGNDLDGTVTPLSGGAYPADGNFSILSSNGGSEQIDNTVIGGQTVNLVIKLHSDLETPDIDLSKTVRVQLNIGENSLAEFLIETGDAR